MASRMTVAAYAKARGVSRPAVLKAAKAGRIKLHDGFVDEDEANRDWAANSRPPRNNGGGRPRKGSEPKANGHVAHAPVEVREAGAGPTLAVSNAKRLAWQARLAQLEFEERSGKLVSADDVKRAVFDAGRRARDMLLGIPDRIAAILAAERDQVEIHRLLSMELRRSLSELQVVFRDRDSSKPD
jgi:hypothetical protein